MNFFDRMRFYWKIRDLYWELIKMEVRSERKYHFGRYMFNKFGDRRFGFYALGGLEERERGELYFLQQLEERYNASLSDVREKGLRDVRIRKANLVERLEIPT